MIISEYKSMPSTEVRIVSLTGEVIQKMRNTDRSGAGLQCKVLFLKNGGVSEIYFSVDKRKNIPEFAGMRVEVYKDNVLFATGFSESRPQSGSTATKLEIKCLGYMHKAGKTTITKSYVSQTLLQILADNSTEFGEIDILYDAGKIDLPSTVVAEISFNNKSLNFLLSSLISIANVDFKNNEYRWFIDNDRYLNIEKISNSPLLGLFEGYHFQKPNVEIEDSKILNTINAYKGASGNSLTYVATYTSATGLDNYGVISEDYVFPDEIDNSRIADICNGILSEFSEPAYKIRLDNLTSQFSFGRYQISTKSEVHSTLLSECDSLVGWNLANAPNTSVVPSLDKALTGRRSLKGTTGAGSTEEYISFFPDSPVFAPSELRLALYLEPGSNLQVQVHAVDGSFESFTLGSSELGIEVNSDGGITKNIEANDTVSTVKNLSLTFTVDYFNQWLRVKFPVSTRTIEEVRIVFLTDTVTSVYIDRLEVTSKSYSSNSLTLEKINYDLTRDYSKASAEFGRTFDTLADVINKKVKAGDVMLSLAAR